MLLGQTGDASAQARQATSMVASVGTQTAQKSAKSDEEERDQDPMHWFGIGAKVGMFGIGAGNLTVKGMQGHTDSRTGLQVAVPLNFGGGGFGWIIEPYLSKSSVSKDVKDMTGAVVGTANVGLMAYGVYTGPTFNIHVMDPLYIGFGLGIKGAYLANNGFDYALDLYGRVPVHATYYLHDQVALVAEVGMGYGASGFADKPRIQIDPLTMSAKNVKDDPQFGMAMTWDATIGVRLP